MAESRNAARYMPDRVSLSGVGIGAAIIAGAIGVGLVAAFVVVHVGSPRPTAPPARRGTPPAIAAPVVLQPSPGQDVAKFIDEKHQLLSSYGWADGGRSFARIPIERAMAMLASQQASAKKP